MKNLLCIAALSSLLSGCTLYFGGDDDDCVNYGDDAPGALEAAGIRNPENGVCEDWWGGGGGGGGCGYAYDQAAPEPAPDWASCYGSCEGLDESSCLVTSGCRAAYGDGALDGGEADADCAPGFCGENAFLGCWGTAPTGPVQGGGCAGLDAYGCSLHDDCSAHYATYYGEDGWTQTNFSYCSDEAWAIGCYSDLECPGGYTCTAEEVCGSPPGCGDGMGGAEPDEACPDVCYGSCVPVEDDGCALVDCVEGTHCELECYPCDGDGDGFEEPMGGGCDPACSATCVPDSWVCEAVDCGPGNHCEEVCTDSLPGTCYSSCVPDETTPTCESLSSQTACDSRVDCTPVYTGYGCTCDASGACDCMTWEFARCESAVMPF